MVHLIASLDGPMIEYVNKMLERGEGRGEKGEGREERGGENEAVTEIRRGGLPRRNKGCACTSGIPW